MVLEVRCADLKYAAAASVSLPSRPATNVRVVNAMGVRDWVIRGLLICCHVNDCIVKEEMLNGVVDSSSVKKEMSRLRSRLAMTLT